MKFVFSRACLMSGATYLLNFLSVCLMTCLTFLLCIFSDINECLTGTDQCSDHSTCVNIDGSYTCHCDDGWQPDPNNDRTCIREW